MNVQDYIKANGKNGVEECEKYVDIETEIQTVITIEEGTPFKRRKKVSIAQVSYFNDTDTVEVYGIDADNNGWFYQWDKLSNKAKSKIKCALGLRDK